MASRCTERSAMANGEAAGEPEMLIRRRAPSGCSAAKASDHHAAQRRAHHGVELLDAQRAHGLEAGARDVLDGELRESRADSARRWPD